MPFEISGRLRPLIPASTSLCRQNIDFVTSTESIILIRPKIRDVKREAKDAPARTADAEYETNMIDTEELRTRQSRGTGPPRNWNVWDVFFFVVPIACIVLFPLGGVDYLCGRFSPFSYSLVRDPLYLMISGCLGLCLCTNVARFLIRLKKHTRKKRVLIAAEILGPPVLFYLSIAVSLVPIERRLYGPT